jgi:hypothetical protein
MLSCHHLLFFESHAMTIHLLMIDGKLHLQWVQADPLGLCVLTEIAFGLGPSCTNPSFIWLDGYFIDNNVLLK